MFNSLQPHELQHARLLCPHYLLLKFMSTESVMLSNHLILCHHLLLLLSIFPSIRVFSSELPFVSSGKSIRSVSFSNSSSNEYSEVISFRIDWFDILSVQRTLKSLLQHHNSKASILRRSAFFIVQLSYLYLTTEKKKKKTHSFNYTDFCQQSDISDF